MARRAVGQIPSVDVVGAEQFLWFPAGLDGRRRCGENVGGRTEPGTRIAMTVQTPPHRERLAFFGARHRPDVPMAGGASHSFCHVNAVIEIDVIRQMRDPAPLQRHISRRAQHHRPQRRHVRENLRMTAQTRLCGWHTREGRCFRRGVAIAAIDPKVACVLPMAEGHGLFGREPDLIPIGRVVVGRRHESGADDQQGCAAQSHSKQDRGPRRKERPAWTRGFARAIRIFGWGDDGHRAILSASPGLFRWATANGRRDEARIGIHRSSVVGVFGRFTCMPGTWKVKRGIWPWQWSCREMQEIRRASGREAHR